MRSALLACVSAAVIALAAPAHATPLNGQTIKNVSIGGTTYHVTFVDESLSQVPQAFQFNFATFSGASSAITAIIATTQYMSLVAPANTVVGTYYSGFIVPYGTLLPPTLRLQEYFGAVYQAASGKIDNFPLYYFPTGDVNTTGDYTVVGYPMSVYALPAGTQFAQVPEPASIAVVALGLFSVGALRRRA